MVTKVLGLALLVACSQALQNDHHNTPTSFVSFNDNHNMVHHIQSAPQQHYAPKQQYAPQLHSVAPAPIKYAAPSYSNYAAPSHSNYAAPSHSNYAVPSHSNYVAPSYSSHQSSSFSSSKLSPSSQYGAPVQRLAQFAPLSHQAAPVSSSYPSHQASSFSSLNSSPSGQYAAPAAHISAQFAPISHQVAPASHQFAPVSHQAAPVFKYSAPVSHSLAPAVQVAPVKYAHAAPAHHEEQYAPAEYEFSYGVQDHHTGDIHSHQESRKGDHTQGEYSLHEADGTIRTVRYTVEGHSGFNAVVERSGHGQAQAQVHQPIKALVAAPQHQYHH